MYQLIIFFFSALDELLSYQTIKVTLKNEVLTHCGQFQDTYEISELVNDKPSWTSQSKAIWYTIHKNWMIGNLDDIGKHSGVIGRKEMLLEANENCKWNYNNGELWKELDTNDFSIECIARKGTNQQLLISLNLFNEPRIFVSVV